MYLNSVLQTECDEWITVAKLMISELTGETWVDQIQPKAATQQQSPSTSTSPSTEQVITDEKSDQKVNI